eukprot:TRINITY_DN3347_c0_g1_i1.p1 TRINITY_DN3347_c0_g1~~TRINITY_DN3347_c0_g1_i1.p1  ORF type:complete len:532 (+),score=147.70 TRINITY_DN3347_c0_g1_i1:56-1597(+)
MPARGRAASGAGRRRRRRSTSTSSGGLIPTERDRWMKEGDEDSEEELTCPFCGYQFNDDDFDDISEDERVSKRLLLQSHIWSKHNDPTDAVEDMTDLLSSQLVASQLASSAKPAAKKAAAKKAAPKKAAPKKAAPKKAAPKKAASKDAPKKDAPKKAEKKKPVAKAPKVERETSADASHGSDAASDEQVLRPTPVGAARRAAPITPSTALAFPPSDAAAGTQPSQTVSQMYGGDEEDDDNDNDNDEGAVLPEKVAYDIRDLTGNKATVEVVSTTTLHDFACVVAHALGEASLGRLIAVGKEVLVKENGHLAVTHPDSRLQVGVAVHFIRPSRDKVASRAESDMVRTRSANVAAAVKALGRPKPAAVKRELENDDDSPDAKRVKREPAQEDETVMAPPAAVVPATPATPGPPSAAPTPASQSSASSLRTPTDSSIRERVVDKLVLTLKSTGADDASVRSVAQSMEGIVWAQHDCTLSSKYRGHMKRLFVLDAALATKAVNRSMALQEVCDSCAG